MLIAAILVTAMSTAAGSDASRLTADALRAYDDMELATASDRLVVIEKVITDAVEFGGGL